MIIKIKETGTIYEVTLRLWRGGFYGGYEPDCFHDMEPNFQRDNTKEDDGTILTTEEDFKDLINWWEEESFNANCGKTGDGLVGLTPEEIARGDKWILRDKLMEEEQK